jgi:exopolysaccharide biosynthesis polyprenyl glycosylphosphotransferase
MRYYLLNLFLGRVVLAAALDVGCFLLAGFLAYFLAGAPYDPGSYAAWIVAGAAVSFVLLYYTENYGLTTLGSGRLTLANFAAFLGVSTLLGLVAYFAFEAQPVTLETVATLTALYVPLMLAGRLGFRALSSRPEWSRRILIVGVSDLGCAIAEAVHRRKNLGAEVAGFLSDDPDHDGGWVEGHPVLGRVGEIEKVLLKEKIGAIVVASKRRDEHFPADELLAAKLRGRLVESGVSFYERVTGRIYLRELRPSYLIFSAGFQGGVFQATTKRAIDLALSSVALLAMLPFVPLVALAIRLDSKGPVFFAQERVGRNGRIFRCLKLRSMYQGAERKTGAVFAAHDDDRVTRVGRFLRMARLDEVPQLWNVLVGDMSFVGPRPERPEFVESLTDEYPYFRARLALKPGLTGWAQIRHGYVNDISGYEDKIALDLYYLKYRSITMDLLILWKTLKTVVLLSGL